MTQQTCFLVNTLCGQYCNFYNAYVVKSKNISVKSYLDKCTVFLDKKHLLSKIQDVSFCTLRIMQNSFCLHFTFDSPNKLDSILFAIARPSLR